MFKIFPTPKWSQLKLKLAKKPAKPKATPADIPMTVSRSMFENGLFTFSEHIKYRGETHLSEDDIIVLSNKLQNGAFQTTFVTLKELRGFILGGNELPVKTEEKKDIEQ